ncbi:MAG TPA: nuclear transport factor 2 family protein [Candidatus Binatia bacterium]|nr:nuclear transport factor 2 family protein [Candidatus Binatia bacterium]
MAAQPISMPTELPNEIKTVIDKLLSGFNNKDSALYSSAFGGEVVVIDGMAPYRWAGPNAQGRWFADAEKWAHDLGVADENIGYDKVIRADVVDKHAYVVLSANLSFTLKGQRASRLGILTFTLAKQGGEWKIESQAWGRLS